MISRNLVHFYKIVLIVVAIMLSGIVLSGCSSKSDESPAQHIDSGINHVVDSRPVTKTINKTTEKTEQFFGADSYSN